MMNGALPPGLRGYAAAQEMDQQQQAGELQRASTLMQLQQHMQAQRSQAQVKDILSKNQDMATAIPALMQAGPEGVKVASTLATLNEHVTKQKTAADKAAFFSPENQKNYMQPGAVTPPTTPVDDNGNPNPAVQGPGAMDMGKFMQDAAARNMIPPEAYANHLAQREQAKATLAQQATLARESQQNRLDIAQQRSEDMKLSQAERNQNRMDVIRLTAAMKASSAPPPMAGDALDMAASRYLLDGTLPPNMGRGAQGSANTQNVLDRAAAMAKAKGMDGEALRISQTSTKSLQQAMGQLEKQRANVMTYEKTALGGADIALEMSAKVDRTGSPVINKWINAGRKNVMGDVDVTRLNNAVETFTNEYAKVMSGSSGGQASTVSMQQHAREMLSGAMTKDQFAGAIDLMKREMKETREKAFDAQIDEMKGRMRSPSATSGAPAAPAPAPTPAATGGGWVIKRK